MECALVVQAVAVAELGPLAPVRMEIWPEARLIMVAGIKNGECAAGRVPAASCARVRLPRIHRSRCRCIRPRALRSPASLSGRSPSDAKSAAAMGELDETPHLLDFFLFDILRGVESLDFSAIWQEKSAGSNWVIRAIPDLPARIASQEGSVPIPSGVSKPTPVTTTLRDQTSLPDEKDGYFLDVLFSSVLHGVLTVVIFSASSSGISSSNASSKAMTNSTMSQRIGRRVVNERRVCYPLALIHAQLLDNNLLYLLLYGCHDSSWGFLRTR